jgi:hypothetical protein
LTFLPTASTLNIPNRPPKPPHDIAQRVGRHYNQLKSLKAGFTESYDGFGRARLKAARCCCSSRRMKWDYTSPVGKLFLTSMVSP